MWNRTPERARELAEALGARVVERPESADVVVNATSVGLHGEDASGLPLDGLDPPETAVELVYPGATPFADWASRVGARVVDGIEVLVRQGALSFSLWTGLRAPLDAMRSAARSERPETAP